MARPASDPHTAALRRAAGLEPAGPSGLRLAGLSSDTEAESGCVLLLRTPSGQMRRVPVDERQLILLVRDASCHLELINRRREAL